MKKCLLLALAALWAGMLGADDNVALPINGDFRGRPAGYSPVPGWFLTADGGAALVRPTRSRHEFCLELAAAPTRPQSVVTALHPLTGSLLKLEVKFSGRGVATVGYETFDSSRRIRIAADRQVLKLTPDDQKLKRCFTLTTRASYIRIRLTAEAGAMARFHGVRAEISGPKLTSVPVPAKASPAAPAVK